MTKREYIVGLVRGLDEIEKHLAELDAKRSDLEAKRKEIEQQLDRAIGSAGDAPEMEAGDTSRRKTSANGGAGSLTSGIIALLDAENEKIFTAPEIVRRLNLPRKKIDSVRGTLKRLWDDSRVEKVSVGEYKSIHREPRH